MEKLENIEKIFLTILLRISIAGGVVILAGDVILYPQDSLSIIIDLAVVIACISSYILRRKYPTAAILIAPCITLIAMFYQSLAVPANTTTSLALILLVGFIFSVLLKGRLMWTLHVITVITLIAIFIIQFENPAFRFSKDRGEMVTVGITYLVIYFIQTYFSATLKTRYDSILASLHNLNVDLQEKRNEIEAQNEELIQIQDNLNLLNNTLEETVNERTEKIRAQNEMLIRYSHSNAHHVRGPVARLLGLINILKLENNPDFNFFFQHVETQVKEIDGVVKQINNDLEGDDKSKYTS